ncbi:hypothetical protein [Nannocystis pusilla]|uniref:hypothetical protein n=1 Tax=Nannocystis pusilla TaxID=889268 RepID=UPI003BF23249
MKSRLLYLALHALVACGPGSGSDTDTATDSDTTGSSSGSSSSDSSSTAPTTGDFPEGEQCTCGGDPACNASICEPFVVGCELEPCDPEAWWAVDDEAALACAIEALRDRKPGSIEWSRTFGFDTGTAERLIVRIRDDGTALHLRSFPDHCTAGPFTHFTIEDAGYFESCLAEPDALARFLCLDKGFREEVASCGEAPATSCDQGSG